MRHNPTSEFTTYDFAAFMQRINAAEAQPTVDLFGQTLVKGTRENTAREIVSRAARGERTVVNFVNAHCVNTLYNDAGYRHALDTSDRILPDGSGMSLAARMAGVELGENLNGTDLFPHICEFAEYSGQAIFLLGGDHGVADGAAAWAARSFPRIDIAGTWQGGSRRRLRMGVAPGNGAPSPGQALYRWQCSLHGTRGAPRAGVSRCAGESVCGHQACH